MAKLNTFWFWEKIDWRAWVEDWERRLLDFIGKGKGWDIWGGAQAGFESLDLTTERIEKEKLLRFVGETEMDDLRVVGKLGPEKFERVEETQKLETDIGIAGLTVTGEIWLWMILKY